MPAQRIKLARPIRPAKFFLNQGRADIAHREHFSLAVCLICYFVWRGLATEIMKLACLLIAVGICLLLPARADLTIVQKVEGAGQGGEMTIKIKGDKARIDTSPKLTTIIDGKTGEITNLMNDQKKIKGDKARIDTSPKLTTIIDGKTGEITNLMNDQKKIKGDKARIDTSPKLTTIIDA